MADDAPRKGPRYPTPASGVRAATARDEYRSRRDEETTPVDMPIPLIASRISERTKGIASTASAIEARVANLEAGHSSMRSELAETRVELAHVSTQVVGLDSKVDVLVDEARESRKERLERERRAENRADEELKFRRDRALKIIAIVVPTLSALGALIAGIIAATRTPEVRYAPAPAPAAAVQPQGKP